MLGAALFVGLLVGGAGGYYFGYDQGWEGAVAKDAKVHAEEVTVNPYAEVETNPLKDVKTNPYDVKLNPFD